LTCGSPTTDLGAPVSKQAPRKEVDFVVSPMLINVEMSRFLGLGIGVGRCQSAVPNLAAGSNENPLPFHQEKIVAPCMHRLAQFPWLLLHSQDVPQQRN
jgi:hypothetical protein